MLETIKKWIGALTELGLLLLALAIVATLLVGANLPFFGNVVTNIMSLVKSLGDAGLVGLIALAIIIWLFSGREIAGPSAAETPSPTEEKIASTQATSEDSTTLLSTT